MSTSKINKLKNKSKCWDIIKPVKQVISRGTLECESGRVGFISLGNQLDFLTKKKVLCINGSGSSYSG